MICNLKARASIGWLRNFRCSGLRQISSACPAGASAVAVFRQSFRNEDTIPSQALAVPKNGRKMEMTREKYPTKAVRPQRRQLCDHRSMDQPENELKRALRTAMRSLEAAKVAVSL